MYGEKRLLMSLDSVSDKIRSQLLSAMESQQKVKYDEIGILCRFTSIFLAILKKKSIFPLEEFLAETTKYIEKY